MFELRQARDVRGAALGLSLLVHAALLINIGGRYHSLVTSPLQTPISARLISAVRPVDPMAHAVNATPRPRTAPRPVQPLSVRGAVKPTQPIAENTPEHRRADTEEAPTPEPPVKDSHAAPAADTLTTALATKHAKLRYLTHVLAHIERHKHYPRGAWRRGIEGKVRVSFVLLTNGETTDISCTGGRAVLREAAEQTVRSALPLPAPPREIEVELPLQVDYFMEFALR